MKCFKYLEIPGIDKIGGNRPAERYYKLVSSAAWNWNRSLVMSETYGAMGNIGWNEIFSVAMDQYAKGINVLIPHAVWYDDKNVTFKPELSQRNRLYADSLKTFNYIDVANWLTEESGKDFTFLHPEVLDEKCIVSNGKLLLQNSVTFEEYKVIIIPSCKTISLSNLKKIKNFYEHGGNVIFTTQLPIYSTEPGKDREVAELIRTMITDRDQNTEKLRIGQGGGTACFIPAPSGAAIRKTLEKLKINYDVEYPQNTAVRYIHKIIKGTDLFYFANTGAFEINTTIQLKGICYPELWDPHTGMVTQSDAITNTGNKTSVILKLPPYHSVFFISRPVR